MPRYLVTGRAGSGKSTVASELRKRGYAAFDADSIDGLSSWIKRTTGQKVVIEDNTNVDLTQYDWLWDGDILRHFISDKETLFICGGAENDFSFETLFDQHFVLDIDADAQIQRLLSRIENDYGKNPAMHSSIVAKQAAHIADARTHGAIIIDATEPIDEVIDKIIATIR